IGVSRPSSGRLTVQKISDYRLSLAAHESYLAARAPITSLEDLSGHRMAGYIPDMIFDSELDYLGGIGIDKVTLASNSVAVQFRWLAQGAGIGIVHDFAMPQAQGLVRVLPDSLRLDRTFWLIRHAADTRVARLDRFAAALLGGLRTEITRLEALA
ncbi:hypothetical protein LCGC14_2099330, partial [marine sediment metagenome]